MMLKTNGKTEKTLKPRAYATKKGSATNFLIKKRESISGSLLEVSVPEGHEDTENFSTTADNAERGRVGVVHIIESRLSANNTNSTSDNITSNIAR